MANFLEHYERLKAKKLGVRVQDFSNISLDSELIMEANSRIGNVRVKLSESDQALSMGAYSYMREGGEIYHLKSIGRFCSIGRNVVLGQPPDNHPIGWVSTSMSVSRNYVAACHYTTIGHDVWIAHNAVIMAGVNIGHGAVIGRDAVVTKDVEPYQIVVGNPAKVVRSRFPAEQIESLLSCKWWNFDYAVLKDLPFGDPDQFLAALPDAQEPANYRKVSIQNRKITVLD